MACRVQRRGWGTGLTLLALLLAGCGKSGPQGEVLRAAVVEEAGADTLARGMANEMTLPTLIERDSAGQIVAGLASSWRLLDDGSALILRMRPLQWSDDKPLVAADVVDRFRRAARPPEAAPLFVRAGIVGADAVAARRRGAVLGVGAPTPRVVEIRLARPSPLLLDWLAEPQAAILRTDRSAATLARYEEVAPAEGTPARTGMVLRRRAMEASPEALPAEVRIEPMAAADKAVAAFRRGALDIVVGEGLAGLNEARLLGRREALRLDPLAAVYGWRTNALKGPLADAGLRRALTDVIDREALAGLFGITAIQPEAGLLPERLRPTLAGAPAEVVAAAQGEAGVAAGLRRAAGAVGSAVGSAAGSAVGAVGTAVGTAANVLTGSSTMDADRMAARQAEVQALVLAARMAAAGRTADAGEQAMQAQQGQPLPPLRLTLLLPAGREHRIVAERVAADWRPLGVELVVQVADRAQRARLIAEGAFDLVVDETHFRVMDAAVLLDRFRCGAGPHCNPAADALLDAASQAPADSRGPLLASAELAMLAGPPMIGLFTSVRWALVGRRVEGWTANPVGVHPLGRLAVGTKL